MNNITLPSPHKILDVIHETNAEYTFRVAYDDHDNIMYGQFFQLSIPKVGEAPISVSGKGDKWLEFTIRKVGKLTNGIFGLQPGDMVFMRGPYGNYFPVDEFKSKDLVVIAGGTGLAAVRALLNHFYEYPEEIKSVNFIAGFKDINSVLFEYDLKKFKTKFNAIYTLDNTREDGFETGMVTAYIEKIPFSTFKDYNVIIELDSRNAEAYYNRGISRMNIQDTEGACSDFNRAVELNYQPAEQMLKLYCSSR